jgi:hypothetical protein
MQLTTIAAPQNPPCFAHADLAEFLNGLATAAHNGAQQRLRQAARHYEDLAARPHMAPITLAQKEEIQRLVAHPLLSRPERTKVLLAYPRMNSEVAAETIKNLQSVCASLDDMRDAV